MVSIIDSSNSNAVVYSGIPAEHDNGVDFTIVVKDAIIPGGDTSTSYTVRSNDLTINSPWSAFSNTGSGAIQYQIEFYLEDGTSLWDQTGTFASVFDVGATIERTLGGNTNYMTAMPSSLVISTLDTAILAGDDPKIINIVIIASFVNENTYTRFTTLEVSLHKPYITSTVFSGSTLSNNALSF